MIRKITVDTKGQRLDIFLVEHLDDVSRSQIKKLILSGKVSLNGSIPSVHTFLKKSDVIEIDLSFFEKEVKKESIDIPVLYEHSDFLIVNKPAGVIVHEFEGIAETSLAEELVQKYPEIASVGDDPKRPGIVHRLDKHVSGLMVVARTQKAFLYLKKQFQERKVTKHYLALVSGKVEKEVGVINFPIKRSQSQRHRMAALPKGSDEGREAITHFKYKGYYKNNTLLDVKIETGRTHQIRVHMNAYGHSVIGDHIYGEGDVGDLNRIFLHSHKLGFTWDDDTEFEFISYLPLDLKHYLNTLTDNNNVFILSGPSGVGKTTLLKQFFGKYKSEFTPTTTYLTREKRSGAVEDKILKHISPEEFKEMIENKEFIEWAEVFGNYYGTHKQTLLNALKEKNVIANIDVQGMQLIMEHIPEAYTVFISLHSINNLKKRITARGELPKEEFEKRINTAKREIAQSALYDEVIYNDQGKKKKAYLILEEFLLKHKKEK